MTALAPEDLPPPEFVEPLTGRRWPMASSSAGGPGDHPQIPQESPARRSITTHNHLCRVMTSTLSLVLSIVVSSE